MTEEALIGSLIHDGKYYSSLERTFQRSAEDIQIVPLKTILSSSQSQGYDGAQRDVLVLPIEITNQSSQILRSKIGHEWYGGEWPSTDLHVFISHGANKIHPVYLVGEKGPAGKPIVLRPKTSVQLDLRMDWPGTGSVVRFPLMQREKPATYDLWIILFSTIGTQNQHTISRKLQIEVAA